jgi:hypothetical protein
MMKQDAVRRLVNDWHRRANKAFMEANAIESTPADGDLIRAQKLRAQAETLVGVAQELEEAEADGTQDEIKTAIAGKGKR